MNCRVVVEAAVPVYDVSTADEAVRIAISKTGEMLNPDLNYVEINMGKRSCPHCGDELEPAFIAADESLVALELEMTVFNVEREEHASRIARKEIGQRLENIPLDVLEIEVLEDDDEDDDEDEEDEEEETEDVEPEAESEGETEVVDEATTDESGGENEEMSTDADAGEEDVDERSDDDEEAAISPTDETEEKAEISLEESSDGADEDNLDDEVLPEFEELIDE